MEPRADRAVSPGDSNNLTAANAGEKLSLLAFLPPTIGVAAKDLKDGGNWKELVSKASVAVEQFFNKPSAFDDRTPRERSQKFQDDTEAALKALRKVEVLTADGKSKPKEITFGLHKLDEDTSLKSLIDSLSADFSPAQRTLYESVFMMQNGLIGKPEDAKFAAGSSVVLPGQTAEGAVFVSSDSPAGTTYYRQNDVRVFIRRGGAEGSGQYRNDKDEVVTVEWSHAFPGRASRSTQNGDNKVVEYSDGLVRAFKLQDAKWQKTQFEFTTNGGMRAVEYYNPGEEYAHTIKMTYRDGSVATLRLDPAAKAAEYRGRQIGADGKVLEPLLAMDAWGNFTKVTNSVDASTGRRLTTKTSMDGTRSHTEDEWHNIISRSGTDAHSRKIEEWLDPTGKVERTKIWPKDASDPIELKRMTSGALRGDWTKDGKSIGTVTQGRAGEFIYTNPAEKMVRTEFPNGAVREVRALPDGGRETVEIPDSTFRRTSIADWQGNQVKETRLYDTKRCVEREYSDGMVTKFAVTEPSGYKTTLTFNSAAQRFEGTRKPPVGADVETVVYKDGKMLFQSKSDKSMRIETYDTSRVEPFQEILKKGGYDANLGTMSVVTGANEVKTEALSGSRTDVITKDVDDTETIEGKTLLGEKSKINADGETSIEKADGSGIRLAGDGKTIEKWDSGGAIQKSELRDFEQKFFKDNPSIDARDLLQLHLAFPGDSKTLQQYYDQLQRINTCDRLDSGEKTALKRNLMHHVAYPSEIAQLNTNTCNVTVVQRDLAMTDPKRYAELVVDAFAKGEIVTAQGKKVPIDIENLKQPDTSGRDLATRTLAGIGYTALYHPHLRYVNGNDGTIQFYRLPRRDGDRPEVRHGIFMGEIAEMTYRLTGKDTAVVVINSGSDLAKAFNANDKKPMIMAVDGAKRPVAKYNDTSLISAHVLTVTDVSGVPPKVRFQNQWGLEVDHSEVKSAVDAAVLVDNASKFMPGRTEGFTQWHGQALVKGDRTKAYRFSGDKLVVDETYTRIIAGERRAIRD